MKIAICYVCVTKGKGSAELAGRFCVSYREHPPGVDHDLIVIGNGGPIDTGMGLLFSWIKAKVWPRENDEGWDISAYIEAASKVCSGYDLMVCLGESCYWNRPGWLARIEAAYNQSGMGMYGVFSSNSIRAHLNTTAFAVSPALLESYPIDVCNKIKRYEFEHGQNAFWRRLESRGYPVRLVTWDGVYAPHVWREPENILWKGDQSNCLLRCKHTDDWEKAAPNRKARWSRNADSAFR